MSPSCGVRPHSSTARLLYRRSAPSARQTQKPVGIASSALWSIALKASQPCFVEAIFEPWLRIFTLPRTRRNIADLEKYREFQRLAGVARQCSLDPAETNFM